VDPSGPTDFIEPDAPAMESQPDRAQPERTQPERRPDYRSERRPESGPRNARVSEAIVQVTEVIDELKHALNEMEDVLETLELAERQKIDDEREIESLQHALRQLHRPGAGGGPPRR
jgi:predicted RNase H-like nuclease (RuvC/YqgF family)